MSLCDILCASHLTVAELAEPSALPVCELETTLDEKIRHAREVIETYADPDRYDIWVGFSGARTRSSF